MNSTLYSALPLDLHLTNTCLPYNPVKSLKILIYVPKSKNLDYLQLKSYMINGNSGSLQGSIINKRYIEVVVVQEKLPQKFFFALLLNTTSTITVTW